MILRGKIFFVEFNGFALSVERLSAPAQLPKRITQVRLIVSLFRIEGDRPAQIFDGLRIMAQAHASISAGI